VSRSTICCFANCLSLALLFSSVGLGQTAAVGNSPTGRNAGVDDAGRPVETAPTPAPPATPSNERQDFRQNVQDVYFAFDRFDLTPEARTTLERDAEWLRAHPQVAFTIEGDADERGSIVYNVFLSDERALATRDALFKLGVPESQVLHAAGWGKLYPVCNESDESCWSKNRRAHIAAWPPEATTAAVAAAALRPETSAAVEGAGK
jgi:peptidoglycan-associated lipoprotein